MPKSISIELLEKLEKSAVATSDNRQSLSPWTLSKDAELCTFLQMFSSHIHEKVSELSETFATLDRTINRVNQATMSATLDYLLLSDEQSTEYESTPDRLIRTPGAYDLVQEMDNDIVVNKNTSDAIETQRDEEEIAIENGIQTAQNLFYNHSVDGHSHDYVSDHFFGFEDDDIVDEHNDQYSSSCHYYESSSGDIFNQRPLPLIVGSDEFLDSEDVGIGGDGGRGEDTTIRQNGSATDESQLLMLHQLQIETKEQLCVKKSQSSPMVEDNMSMDNSINNANKNEPAAIKQEVAGPGTSLDSGSLPGIPLRPSLGVHSLTSRNSVDDASLNE